MKYLPIINLISLILMAYWLVKDMPWFISFKNKLNAFMYRVYDFFCNICERIADDIEVY